MKKVRTAREKGEMVKDVRLVLICAGGLMRGAYCAGFVNALYDEGFNDIFHSAIGISAGAPTIAYYLAGEQRIGSTIYFEECTTPAFLSFVRLRNMLSIKYLSETFQGYTGKALSTQKVIDSPVNFVTIVTSDKGEALYVKPTDHQEVHEAIAGSCALPLICNEQHILNGKRVYDGGVADSMPYDYVKKEIDPTHVLIIANRPAKIGKISRFARRTHARLAMRLLRRNQRQLTKDPANLSINKFYQNIHRFLDDPEIKTAVAWSPKKP